MRAVPPPVLRRGAAVAIGLALGVSAGLGAHHSITAIYDSAKQVTVTGTVREFRFVNPHPWLGIDVDDGAGRPQPWRLDLDNRYELVDVGMKGDTFRVGDVVTARGSAARDGSNNLYTLQLDRPADGLHYEQVGSSPRLRFARR